MQRASNGRRQEGSEDLEVQKRGERGTEEGEVQKKGRCRRWRGTEERHEQKKGRSTLTTGTGKHIYKHIPVRRWRVITSNRRHDGIYFDQRMGGG